VIKHWLFISILTVLFFSCNYDSKIITEKKTGEYTLVVEQTPIDPLPGNRIRLDFRFTGKRPKAIVYPQLSEIQGLEPLTWDKHKNGATLELLAKTGGEYTIPEISFLLDTVNQIELSIPSWIISIPKLATENSEWAENSPFIHMGLLKTWQWLVVILILLLSGLLIFYFFIYKRNKQQKPLLLSQKMDQYRSKLDLGQYIENKNPHGFYLELTGALRFFIDHLFKINSTEQTSSEYLPQFLNLPVFKKTEHPWLIELVDRADSAKYANDETSIDKMLQDKEQAESLFANLIQYQKDRESYETT